MRALLALILVACSLRAQSLQGQSLYAGPTYIPVPSTVMPITVTAQAFFDDHSSTTYKSSATFTIPASGSMNVSAGSTLVGCIATNFGALSLVANLGTTPVTDTAGDTFTLLTEQDSVAGPNGVIGFYVLSSAGNAANVVTVHTSASLNSLVFIYASVIDITGGLTAVDVNAAGGANASSGTTLTSGAYSTTAAREIAVACGWNGNITSTFTAGSGFALQNQSVVGFTETQIYSTTQSTVTATATSSASNPWIMKPYTFQ